MLIYKVKNEHVLKKGSPSRLLGFHLKITLLLKNFPGENAWVS